jgi:putative transposase
VSELPSGMKAGRSPGGSRLSSLPLRRPIDHALTIQRRALPHWQMGGATYYLTFRLQGIPRQVKSLSMPERFIVRDALLHYHRVKWDVHLLTVMPDHAHALVTPRELAPGKWHSLSVILQSIKGYSARLINIERGRTGRLWQSESFDRIVRDEAEFDEKAIYILNNAVKAGLVEDGWMYEGFWCDAETAD